MWFFLFFKQEVEEPKNFSTFRERLYHLQVNFHHFCSAIILLSTSWIDDFFFFFVCIHTRLQRTENDRVCFGRSGIHGWGLFARQAIQEGDMVHTLKSSNYRVSKEISLFLFYPLKVKEWFSSSLASWSLYKLDALCFKWWSETKNDTGHFMNLENGLKNVK